MIAMRQAQNRGELMRLRNRLGRDEVTIPFSKDKTLPLLAGANRFQSSVRLLQDSGRLLG